MELPLLATAVVSVKSGARIDASDTPVEIPSTGGKGLGGRRKAHSALRRNNFSTVKKQGFKHWWRDIHEVYRKDTSTWGFGTNPIFTVYEGPDGGITKVLIDEDEIQRRAGVNPSRSNTEPQERLLLAKSLANDMETGNKQPPSNSTIFKIVKHKKEGEESKLIYHVDSVINKAAPVITSVSSLALTIYGICILWGAYKLHLKRSKGDTLIGDQSAARLMKMKNWRARIDRKEDNETTKEVQYLADVPSDFMEKVQEVRDMARQVKYEQGIPLETQSYSGSFTQQPINGRMKQMEICETSTDNKEELTNVCLPVDASATGLPPRETFAHAKGMVDNIDAPVTEVNVQADGLGNVSKPLSKARPHIIMSLEEAKSTLASRKARLKGPAGVATPTNKANDSPLVETKSTADDGLAFNGGIQEVQSSINRSSASSTSAETTGSRDADKATGFDHDVDCKEQAGQRREENESKSIVSHSEGSEWKLPVVDLECMEIEPLHGITSVVQENDKPGGESVKTVHSNDIKMRHPVEEYWKDPNAAARSLLLSKPKDFEQEALQDLTGDAESSYPHSERLSNTAMQSSKPGKILVRNASSKLHDTMDVVGSGQPLRKEEIFAYTKRWGKELQKKYDTERDLQVRELIREIGSELDSWVTEQEIEEAGRLALKLEEEEEDYVDKHLKVQQKIKEQRQRFGIEAVLNKYKEYQPDGDDKLWWLDLPCVLCVMATSKTRGGSGLYSLDMTIDLQGKSKHGANHIIAFEDQKDAMQFCHLLENKSQTIHHAQVLPFCPKELFKIARQEGYKVTVLKKGQIQATIEQAVEEVESKILEIGTRAYWEKLERERTIDVDSILSQGFGL